MMAHVLIVQDEALSRQAIWNALTTEGYKVSVTKDGRAAMHELKTEKYAFDLIITDLFLPFASGLEIISSIKLKSPHYIPVIILNGAVYADEFLSEETTAVQNNPRRRLPASELLMHVHAVLNSSRPQ